jgi:lipopolysaccharide/colanic/teichoic acid biosynthesis glycosyltransferase
MAFFPESMFSKLLLLERKRSERSGHPFALALLETNASDLRLQLRATDLAGWYKENSTLGIIFTTLNGAPIEAIRSTLRSKIHAMVQDKVRFRLLIYPHDVDGDLFPEVPKSATGSTFNFMKRVVDIGASLAVILFLSPVFLAISLFVKLSSPGPVFFRQRRIGFLGKEFEFLKFRSMYANNDPSIHKEYVAKLIEGKQKSSGVYKIRKDPRITKFGAFLRKSSLDELPQFFNVLKGEMSLVGPRPPIRYEVDKYQCWHRRRVLEVKPGITGLWQVMGRSRTSFDEMVRLDIQYIREQSPWLDIKIVLLTPAAILSASGAY